MIQLTDLSHMISVRKIHPDVLKLGFVSFLTDLSSEMIFGVFAIAFTTVAGGSARLLGLIEGFADFSACSLDYVAGWSSDHTGMRKPLAFAGYAFSTLAKLILPLANSAAAFGGFRITERLGKSFRGPPRDAWLTSLAAKDVRGYSLGVHKALDKAGAVLGPLAGYGLLSLSGATAAGFKILFWVALVPALASLVVFRFIKERPGERREHMPFFAAWHALTPAFKRYLLAAALFSLGYFSFGFLLLRAYDLGFSVRSVVLLYALCNGAFVVAAPIIGKWGDRFGRPTVLLASYLIYALISAGFAFASARWQIVALFALYGVFFSIDEAQSKAYIADVEARRRATAIGVYNFVTGICYLPASLIAGALWTLGPRWPFGYAAAIALIAAILFRRMTVRAGST